MRGAAAAIPVAVIGLFVQACASRKPAPAVEFALVPAAQCDHGPSLDIRVTDGRRPIPGATIELSSYIDSGSRVVVTDGRGAAAWACLPWNAPPLDVPAAPPRQVQGAWQLVDRINVPAAKSCFLRVAASGYEEVRLEVPLRNGGITLVTVRLAR